jgi:hypothetical protein
LVAVGACEHIAEQVQQEWQSTASLVFSMSFADDSSDVVKISVWGMGYGGQGKRCCRASTYIFPMLRPVCSLT